PWVGETAGPQPLSDNAGSTASGRALPLSAVLHSAGAGGGDDGVSFVVPLTITVKLGDQSITGGAQRQPAPPPPRTDRTSAEAAAEKVRQHLLVNKSVLSVKADYLFRDGVITDDYGVMVGAAPGPSVDPAPLGLDSELDGVTISIETADPATIAEQMFAFQTEAFSGRVAQYRRDLTDPLFDLSPVTDDISVLLHVSPEAGWPVLKEFLGNTSHKRLTIGMYNMTAPHVVEAIEDIAKRKNTKITLTIDRQR